MDAGDSTAGQNLVDATLTSRGLSSDAEGVKSFTPGKAPCHTFDWKQLGAENPEHFCVCQMMNSGVFNQTMKLEAELMLLKLRRDFEEGQARMKKLVVDKLESYEKAMFTVLESKDFLSEPDLMAEHGRLLEAALDGFLEENAPDNAKSFQTELKEKIIAMLEEFREVNEKRKEDALKKAEAWVEQVYETTLESMKTEVEKLNRKMAESAKQAITKRFSLKSNENLMKSAEEEVEALMNTLAGKVMTLLEKSDSAALKAEILDQKQKKIELIMENLKLDYNRKTDALFTKSPQELDDKQLVQLNINSESEGLKLLEMEIRQKIGDGEPVEQLAANLRAHCSQYWQETALSSIIDYYKMEMERNLADGPVSAEKFSEIDRKVRVSVKKGLDAFINAKDEQPNNFKTQLNSAFDFFKEENAAKLKETNSRAEIILEKAKKDYSRSIEEILSAFPGGRDRSKFAEDHQKFSKVAASILERKVMMLTGGKQLLEKFQQTLQVHIDKKYLEVMEINRKNLEKTRKLQDKLYGGSYYARYDRCSYAK